MEKRFWPFFVGLSSVTNLKRQTVRVQKVVWQLLRFLQDHFYLATPSSLVKTKTFEKKKAIFPVKKSFWPVFPQSIECEKASGRFLRVHNVFWQLLWKLSELFCNTYEVVENKTSWKKGKLSSEKTIVVYFSRGIKRDKCQQTPYKGPEGWQNLCKLWVCFYMTYEFIENTLFWKKKANFPVKKKVWPTFSRIIEFDKPQWTICKGPKGNLTITVEVIRSILSSNT